MVFNFGLRIYKNFIHGEKRPKDLLLKFYRFSTFACLKAGFMKKKIPFEFVLDRLHPLEITIKPMFGCHAIYANSKIQIILRKREDHMDANGIWMATGKEHHESLRKEFPNMRSVYILSDGKRETDWQMIHDEEDDFEESAIKICEMIQRSDVRIGRIPKSKKKKARA